jgi:hypothetical protein
MDIVNRFIFKGGFCHENSDCKFAGHFEKDVVGKE